MGEKVDYQIEIDIELYNMAEKIAMGKGISTEEYIAEILTEEAKREIRQKKKNDDKEKGYF